MVLRAGQAGASTFPVANLQHDHAGIQHRPQGVVAFISRRSNREGKLQG